MLFFALHVAKKKISVTFFQNFCGWILSVAARMIVKCNYQTFFSFLDGGKSKIKVPADLVLGKGLLAMSSKGGGRQASSLLYFLKTLIPP